VENKTEIMQYRLTVQKTFLLYKYIKLIKHFIIQLMHTAHTTHTQHTHNTHTQHTQYTHTHTQTHTHTTHTHTQGKSFFYIFYMVDISILGTFKIIYLIFRILFIHYVLYTHCFYYSHIMPPEH
jgi:hypothetical protein